MYPELKFELPKTLALIRRELEKLDIPYTEEYGKSSSVRVGRSYRIPLEAVIDYLYKH